ncbi:hypothetical protein MXB_1097, partial [Myxobolus squamalis]
MIPRLFIFLQQDIRPGKRYILLYCPGYGISIKFTTSLFSCANGKYFSKYEHFMIGCDICLPLLLNCDRSRVFRDNAANISLRYPNDNKALAKSLSLVVEGSETAPSDLLVPWTETSNQMLNKKSTKYRYYHLYEYSEIIKLCEIFKSKIKIQDLFLDHGNWFLIIRKH